MATGWQPPAHRSPQEGSASCGRWRLRQQQGCSSSVTTSQIKSCQHPLFCPTPHPRISRRHHGLAPAGRAAAGLRCGAGRQQQPACCLVVPATCRFSKQGREILFSTSSVPTGSHPRRKCGAGAPASTQPRTVLWVLSLDGKFPPASYGSCHAFCCTNHLPLFKNTARRVVARLPFPLRVSLTFTTPSALALASVRRPSGAARRNVGRR